MLKINLLPSYIYERRKVRQVAIACVIMVLAVGGGMFAWISQLNNQKAQLTSDVMTMEQNANDVKAIEAQATAEEAKAPPIQSKTSYIEAIMAYNEEYPKLYEELAKYTYSRIEYKTIEPSAGTGLKITAQARSVGDCGRYLLNMYRASHIFNSVTIDAVPGWSGDITQGFDFNVTCNLVKPITAPAFGSAGAAPGTPGA